MVDIVYDKLKKQGYFNDEKINFRFSSNSGFSV